MPKKITIIDSGIGNLFSISRALETVGAEIEITSDAKTIAKAQHLILPGVGAFSTGMSGLHEQELDTAIIEHSQSGKPLLGICLGMQMLMSSSEEHGNHQGLNLIPGQVKKIPNRTIEGNTHKIPHIGWNALQPPSEKRSWKNTILENTIEGDAIYFVHSFFVTPDSFDDALAITYYGGHKISAVVNRGNVYGCQFHPEKSGKTGLNILKRFVQI